MKMKMKTEFILREFIFAKIGISEDIDTSLAPRDIRDAFVKYGKEKYTYDEKSEKVILKDNFAVKLNTGEMKNSNLIKLEFFRYYHRYYVIYAAISFILSIFLAVAYQFPPGISRKIGINLILFMIPLALFLIINETIKSVKGIKGVDYSKEAERVYLEILNAIKEKEKRA